jgi:hypothetical protein
MRQDNMDRSVRNVLIMDYSFAKNRKSDVFTVFWNVNLRDISAKLNGNVELLVRICCGF